MSIIRVTGRRPGEHQVPVATPALQFVSGVEGPRHDPYGWGEVRYTCPVTAQRYVLRTSALGYVRLVVTNGAMTHMMERSEKSDPHDSPLARLFEVLVGLSAAELNIAREQDAARTEDQEDPMGSIES